MSELEQWNFIVGAGLPLLIAVLQRPTFPAAARSMITVATCAIAALIEVHLVHGLHIDGHLFSSILQVTASAIIFYKGVWQPTGLAPVIEAKTSPAEHRHAA